MRFVREQQEMSARELDRRIGFNYGFVARAERRGQAVDVKIAAEIARALGCRLEYLVSGKYPMYIESEGTEDPQPQLEEAIDNNEWPDWVVAMLWDMVPGLRGQPSARQWERMASHILLLSETTNDIFA